MKKTIRWAALTCKMRFRLFHTICSRKAKPTATSEVERSTATKEVERIEVNTGFM